MNKARMTFVTLCSGVTLLIFVLYALVVVPVVLPAKEKAGIVEVPHETLKDRELLEILFSPDSWVFGEKTNVMSFSEGAGIVLFREGKFLDDQHNQLQVTPCVVVCFPSRADEMSPQEKYRQAVVLEAENHALFELEGALGFSSAPQLKNGQLNGIVTIRSQMKNPDPFDDIWLQTSDVLFNFELVQTRQRVNFKFGPNYGHGYNLTIQMANTDESKKGEAPNTVERIELHRLGELHLYVENDDLSYSTVRRDMPTPYHVAAYPQAIPQDTSTGSPFQLHAESASSIPSSTLSSTPSSMSAGQTSREQFTLSRETAAPPLLADLQTTSTTPGMQTQATSSANPPSMADMSEVLVMCQGIVDMVADSDNPGQWLLTFRNQVNVLRTNPQGAADQLNCQELALTFGSKADDNPTTASMFPPPTAPTAAETNDNPLANFNSLSPLRVKATGAPVIARSPENKGFQATGREMVLDLVNKMLSLTTDDGVPAQNSATQSDEVSVLYDGFRVRGKAIYYAFDDGDGPGKLDMPGVGTLEGATGTNADKRFKLQWNDELKVLPSDPGNPDLTVVQIRGNPKAELSGIGTAAADEIIIWCDTGKKQPSTGAGRSTTLAAADDKWNVDLQKIQMRKNVVLKTDTGEIITHELEIDFRQPAMTAIMTPPPISPMQTTPQAQLAQATRFVSRYPDPQARGTGAGSSVGSTGSQNSLSKLSLFGDGSGGKSTYTVRADKVEVLASMAGEETVVSQILLTKNVNLDERTSEAGAEPIHISGQTVRISNPDSLQLVVNIFGDANVSGGHAVFKGRGVMLMGANINVDRQRNLFWVDGQGELRVTQQSTAGAGGQSTGSFSKLFSSDKSGGSQAIVIDWTGSMEFNGKVLLFLKDVDVHYSMMAINKSERIEVHLKKPFHFFDKDDSTEIEPERVVIHGNIDLERDSFDEKTGNQLSHDRIRLTAVEIFPQTGLFKGLGPGYVSSIFQYDGDTGGLLSGGGSASTGSTTASTAGSSGGSGLFDKGLKFMQCNFNGSVEGNYETGQVAFYDRVVTMLCPARSFRDEINTTNTRNIVANGMVLECNKLDISQFQAGGAKTVDLKAEGNTLIEMTYGGRYYIANADKIKFEQAKNLLTLEGDRNSDVVLHEAANMNAPTGKPISGKLIQLNPVTKEVRGDGLSGNFLVQ